MELTLSEPFKTITHYLLVTYRVYFYSLQQINQLFILLKKSIIQNPDSLEDIQQLIFQGIFQIYLQTLAMYHQQQHIYRPTINIHSRLSKIQFAQVEDNIKLTLILILNKLKLAKDLELENHIHKNNLKQLLSLMVENDRFFKGYQDIGNEYGGNWRRENLTNRNTQDGEQEIIQKQKRIKIQSKELQQEHITAQKYHRGNQTLLTMKNEEARQQQSYRYEQMQPSNPYLQSKPKHISMMNSTLASPFKSTAYLSEKQPSIHQLNAGLKSGMLPDYIKKNASYKSMFEGEDHQFRHQQHLLPPLLKFHQPLDQLKSQIPHYPPFMMNNNYDYAAGYHNFQNPSSEAPPFFLNPYATQEPRPNNLIQSHQTLPYASELSKYYQHNPKIIKKMPKKSNQNQLMHSSYYNQQQKMHQDFNLYETQFKNPNNNQISQKSPSFYRDLNSRPQRGRPPKEKKKMMENLTSRKINNKIYEILMRKLPISKIKQQKSEEMRNCSCHGFYENYETKFVCMTCGLKYHLDCMYNNFNKSVNRGQFEKKIQRNNNKLECRFCKMKQMDPFNRVSEVIGQFYIQKLAKYGKFEEQINMKTYQNICKTGRFEIQIRCIKISKQETDGPTSENEEEQSMMSSWPDNSVLKINNKEILEYPALDRAESQKSRQDTNHYITSFIFHKNITHQEYYYAVERMKFTLEFQHTAITIQENIHSQYENLKEQQYRNTHNINNYTFNYHNYNNSIRIRNTDQLLKEFQHQAIDFDAEYAFGIYLVEKINVNQMYKNILIENQQKQADKNSYTLINFIESTQKQQFLQFHKKIDEQKSESGNNVIEYKVKIPFQDCYTSLPIKTAVKGVYCRHIECFDLETYLEYTYENKISRWRCPYCKKNTKRLVIDKLLNKILKEVGDVAKHPKYMFYYVNSGKFLFKSYKQNALLDKQRQQIEDLSYEQRQDMDMHEEEFKSAELIFAENRNYQFNDIQEQEQDEDEDDQQIDSGSDSYHLKFQHLEEEENIDTPEKFKPK